MSVGTPFNTESPYNDRRGALIRSTLEARPPFIQNGLTQGDLLGAFAQALDRQWIGHESQFRMLVEALAQSKSQDSALEMQRLRTQEAQAQSQREGFQAINRSRYEPVFKQRTRSRSRSPSPKRRSRD